jgi:transcriptional regulator with XRE-family HTH domain
MSKRRLIQLLREVRREAKLTQRDLAARIGETQSYVSKYESGEQRLDLLEIEAICKVVGLSLRDFIDRYVEN